MAKRTLNSFKFQPDTPVILCFLYKTKFKARRGIDYRFAQKRGMFPYRNHEGCDRLRFVKGL